ncbi:MAG TPA: L-idonate 5-dehydrogenase [Afifellaceae bacterium]|nr:L-idonate 5-dehydrogenase [Afifellaceae bacterium]
MKAVVIHSAKDLRIEDATTGEAGFNDVVVRVDAGGICGSDLHYYNHGGFGAIRIQEPMILGHEIAGTVEAVGETVTSVRPGDRVVVNPSLPCRSCRYCQLADYNHCLDMRFYGSAMRMPHIQGAFRQRLVADADQCHVFSNDVSANEAAFAEPFSVALHAVNRVGSLLGRRVLVTGSGPIGALVVLAARHHGALQIVATDIVDEPLQKALSIGADTVINVAAEAERLAEFEADKGVFDVVFEASGNPKAVSSALQVVKPRGTLIQLGLGGDATLPLNMITAKEIELKGSVRFHEEFAVAVDLISRRLVDVKPLLTDILPLSKAVEAFELAGDRAKAMKVHLAMQEG